MKLIKRTSLLYQEGRSDKVYEVDLCQVGEDRYLVNFRYGRRGTTLKEGSKTIQAVPEAEARRVFDKLISSQMQKGYRDVSSQSNDTPIQSPVSVPNVPVIGDVRQQAVLNRLAHQGSSKWPLERAIWRAGELRIREATPLLFHLMERQNSLSDYCIVWALGLCGDESAIPFLRQLIQDASVAEFIRRIAWEALMKLANAETQAALRFEKLNQLPSELRSLAENGSDEAFAQALNIYLNGGEYRQVAILDTLYQIDTESIRPAFLKILRTAPLKPNYFQRLRHIFKIAEYRQDGEVFGILAYRFEHQKSMYRSNRYYIRLPGGGYLSRYDHKYNPQTRQYETSENPAFQQEMQSPNARIAYSDKTREYLLHRVWRSLRQLGEEGDRNYVKMAVGILLQYSDADAKPILQSTFYRWDSIARRSIQYNRSWDAYAGYLTFNHILYEHSPRYVLASHKTWRCRDTYQPGNPEPTVREEAFPKLWEQQPEELLRLLLESRCSLVHHFAVKAFRACQQFWAEVDLEAVIKLVNQPYEVTAQLGFELARERYNAANPNLELVLALANCLFQPARTQAYQWIDSQRDRFLIDSHFIAALVTSQYSDTRSFARRLLSSSILSDQTAKVLIGRIIAALVTLEPTQTDLAREIGETLLLSFTPQLRNIGFDIILDLLGHPMPEIQELGARILLNHEIPAIELPSDLIESLLNSPYEGVRGIGMRIFGQLPEATLLQRDEILVIMATHELADMRRGVRPIIRRLGTQYPEFAISMAIALINILMKRERHEGVHSDVVRLLREDLQGWMAEISPKTVMGLLRAQFPAAQEVGGVVLKENSDRFLHEFDTSELVKLANHDIFTVREAAREMFLHRLDRIRTDKQEMLSAVRILESKWDDSRNFAVNLFTHSFTSEDWTPEVMISICDSIREEVRQFGRDLVTRNFQASEGQDYLLKFSEHPSSDMQMFATNYLENYAADNSERLRELIPYFITVLSAVNRGRVAKQRIFAFLETEAQKSESAAQIVAEILTRQSLTIAIGDKGKSIQTMLKIHQQYPQISLPIQIKAVAEVRR